MFQYVLLPLYVGEKIKINQTSILLCSKVAQASCESRLPDSQFNMVGTQPKMRREQ